MFFGPWSFFGVICRNSLAARFIQDGWNLFLYSTLKVNYFSCAYFCFAAHGECVFVHLSALALARRAPAGSIWGPWMEFGGWGVSEWGVTAVSGSLPPLLFKSKHAFAHKDTHRHVGMCCATFSGDIRGVNAATAGKPQQHTQAHRCLQDMWEASRLLLSPLLWLSFQQSALLVWPCSFMLCSQEKVKKNAVHNDSMQLSLSLCKRGFQSHHSNTEIRIHSVLHPIDVTDGKSDP